MPRRSDDLDILVEDEPITTIAEADIGHLAERGLRVVERRKHYGFAIEADIGNGRETSSIEWSEADRNRFFPVEPHPTFGWTLSKTDLAVQKLVAAASRRAPRDAVDILLIDASYMDLAILEIAAPGKMEGTTPTSVLDRALRIAMSHPAGRQILLSIKPDLSDRIGSATETIIDRCPRAEAGFLYIDPATGTPTLPTNDRIESLVMRPASLKGLVPMVRPNGKPNGRPNGKEDIRQDPGIGE